MVERNGVNNCVLHTPTQQIMEQFNQLPPQIQQAAVPDLQNIYNQAVQLTQAAMQNQQMMQGEIQ